MSLGPLGPASRVKSLVPTAKSSVPKRLKISAKTKECRLKLVKELDSFFYIYKDDEEACRNFGVMQRGWGQRFFGMKFITSSYIYIY